MTDEEYELKNIDGHLGYRREGNGYIVFASEKDSTLQIAQNKIEEVYDKAVEEGIADWAIDYGDGMEHEGISLHEELDLRESEIYDEEEEDEEDRWTWEFVDFCGDEKVSYETAFNRLNKLLTKYSCSFIFCDEEKKEIRHIETSKFSPNYKEDEIRNILSQHGRKLKITLQMYDYEDDY